MNNTLFTPIKAGAIELQNKVAMAPMTRSRAGENNVPTAIMADYYGQRAAAGLIITEGTSPSPNGVGYPRIPGIYNAAQVEAWKKVTQAVHEKGGHIFMQLMHTGRVTHPDNLPAGAEVVAPSAIAANEQMYTDKAGMQQLPTPRELTTQEVKSTIEEYLQGAKNAIEAGFDGVELHAANGYLIEQFINPGTNQRTDEYGGGIAQRAGFLLQIASQIAAAIGKDKVGVRFSPYGAFNDMPAYGEVNETYAYLAEELSRLDILYVHTLDHSSLGAPAVAQEVKDMIRSKFKNLVILCGGFDKAKAGEALANGTADLIAFGRPFISNPDLVKRMEQDAEIAQPDFGTFYSPGVKGYNDYPVLEEKTA